jgi:membrane-bound metal-dependent hydrolase YbcI (DUF457 family)
MMGTSHALSGAAVWLTGCAVLTQLGVEPAVEVVWLGTVVCAGGALLPDIDHPKSLVSRCGIPLTAIVSRLVARRLGHRGATHYLIAAPIGAAVVELLALATSTLTGAILKLVEVTTIWAAFQVPLTCLRWTYPALVVGYVTHILGDACTDSGVPLLGPWSERRRGVWSPARFKTGQTIERTLATPILWCVVAATSFSMITK